MLSVGMGAVATAVVGGCGGVADHGEPHCVFMKVIWRMVFAKPKSTSCGREPARRHAYAPKVSVCTQAAKMSRKRRMCVYTSGMRAPRRAVARHDARSHAAAHVCLHKLL